MKSKLVIIKVYKALVRNYAENFHFVSSAWEGISLNFTSTTKNGNSLTLTNNFERIAKNSTAPRQNPTYLIHVLLISDSLSLRLAVFAIPVDINSTV